MPAFNEWLKSPSKYCTKCGTIQSINNYLKKSPCFCGNDIFEEMEEGRAASIREEFMQDEVDKAMQRGKYRVGGPEDMFGELHKQYEEP